VRRGFGVLRGGSSIWSSVVVLRANEALCYIKQDWKRSIRLRRI
jgi:hypothetical protein